MAYLSARFAMMPSGASSSAVTGMNGKHAAQAYRDLVARHPDVNSVGVHLTHTRHKVGGQISRHGRNVAPNPEESRNSSALGISHQCRYVAPNPEELPNSSTLSIQQPE